MEPRIGHGVGPGGGGLAEDRPLLDLFTNMFTASKRANTPKNTIAEPLRGPSAAVSAIVAPEAVCAFIEDLPGAPGNESELENDGPMWSSPV